MRRPEPPVNARARSRLRVRWIIFGYMFAFAFIIYLQRTSFSVTAVQMMPELGITQVQLGWLFTAYLIAYTAFQLPGGIFGEWAGARKALVVTGLLGVLRGDRNSPGAAGADRLGTADRAADRAHRARRGARTAVSDLDGRVRVVVPGRPLGIAERPADRGPAIRFGGRYADDRHPDGITRLEECAAVDDAAGVGPGCGCGAGTGATVRRSTRKCLRGRTRGARGERERALQPRASTGRTCCACWQTRTSCCWPSRTRS